MSKFTQARRINRVLALGALTSMMAIAASAQGAAITWDDGGGVDNNWSTVSNWSDNATATNDDVTFNNTGGAAGTTVTSVVDTTISIDSLNFSQTNAVNHTMEIANGQTLTVAGSFVPTAGEATAVLFGQPNDAGTTASTTNITGTGTFTVNSAANHFLVGYANATGNPTITVNMSGLSNFNATVDIFGVGRKGTTSANASRQQAGILTLADNNTITANEISVGSTTHIGGTTGTHNNGGTSTLNLGSGGNAINNLNADLMSFGIGKATGNMNFAAGAVSSDSVKIRAKNGSSAVGLFEVGVRNMSSSSGTPAGTVNFGAGKVDALINVLTIGNWANGAGNSGVSPTGTFTTGTNANSTITVTTLNMGISGSGTALGSAQIVTGNLNVDGGVFSATTVNLATGTATTNLTKNANLSVDGGTFRFGSFGTPTGTNNVSIKFESGTIASIDGTNRSLALPITLGKVGGSTVAFGQSSGGTGDLTFSGIATLAGNTTINTVQTATFSNAINGGFGITKTGADTLILNGTNGFSGNLTVSEGIVDVNGSLASNAANKNFIAKDATDDFTGSPELQRAVGALSSLAGIGATEVGGLATVATLIGGATNGATSVDMAFRGRNNSIVAGETSLLSSDILQLEGLDGIVFVLQMSYDPAVAALNGQAENTLRLGYLNTTLNRWEDAVLGNHGVNTGTFFLSSWVDAGSTLDLGAFGVDVVNNVVWAVLDHNSFFAVIPTPGALPAGLLLMGLVAATKRRRQA